MLPRGERAKNAHSISLPSLKKEEINVSKIYSPSGKFAKRAKKG